MAEFHGTVELISGITPKNGGDFALVGAHDVQVDDQGNRLDTEFSNLKSALNNIEDRLYDASTFDFSTIGIEEYPYGWRTGYYNLDHPGGTSSITYARSRNVISLKDVIKLSFTPPSGYASSIVLKYTEDGVDKYDIVGEADSTTAYGREYIDRTLDVDCSKYDNARITVGKFTNTGGSVSYVQDEEWVKSISLVLYKDKDDESAIKANNISEFLGLEDYDIQDGYYNSSSVSRISSTTAMSTRKIPIIGKKVMLQCPDYTVSVYWYKTEDSKAYKYTSSLNGKYLVELTVPESDQVKYVAVNITKNIELSDDIREDIKSKLFLAQYNEQDFRFVKNVHYARIATLNENIEALLPSFSKSTDLKILHFSDPHAAGNDRNMPRIIEFYNNYAGLLNDVLSTGDNVHEYYSDNYGAFTENAGCEKILTVIGNHDVADSSIPSHYITSETEETLCNKFFFGINTWNVTHPTGKTYWYKDYAKIRLIGLNTSLDSTLADLNSYPDKKSAIESAEQAQLTWLENALSDAKTNSKSVVIATHFSVKNAVKVDCSFSSDEYSLLSVPGKSLSESIQAKVQSFIDSGGEFIAFLSGHAHMDMVAYNENYPSQLDIVVTSSNYTLGDIPREYSTKTQDAFNIVAFDCTNKLIKVIRIGADRDNHLKLRSSMCINYVNKSVLANN